MVNKTLRVLSIVSIRLQGMHRNVTGNLRYLNGVRQKGSGHNYAPAAWLSFHLVASQADQVSGLELKERRAAGEARALRAFVCF